MYAVVQRGFEHGQQRRQVQYSIVWVESEGDLVVCVRQAGVESDWYKCGDCVSLCKERDAGDGGTVRL